VYAGGNVTTDQFIAMAERLSGQELDDLFHTWLFTAQKPTRTLIPDAAVSLGDVPAIARAEMERHDQEELLATD